ncbi:hypothetical protein BGZ80_011071 [Entomortierella chlamydospora]|uniref:Uncharacterized protein n=1 Tax=Entomortierella chlamydospora TaxID=101097 RepID=A0A9P6MUN2_9FUNG|nr:hypothetical protein BGZ79_008549 [Entomortierella chlamydospora]KAG0013445.1 hypothetical protein BGZ80_011071 [Entomortierella chlamydospora]
MKFIVITTAVIAVTLGAVQTTPIAGNPVDTVVKDNKVNLENIDTLHRRDVVKADVKDNKVNLKNIHVLHSRDVVNVDVEKDNVDVTGVDVLSP